MKTPSLLNAILFASALTAMISSAPLHAQNIGPSASVTVPFGFEFGSHHFAPGTYTLAHPAEHILALSTRSDTDMNITRWERSKQPTDKAKVVFHRYGNRYFLREVWPAADTGHLECSESTQERQVRNADVAAVTPDSTNVELALLQTPRPKP